MKTLSTTIRVLTCAVFILSLSSLAQAQASRTWVSGVGDDVNPCSRTAPCKTFAGAISKTADGGEINALDSGGYGAVTITKGMTIDGAGVHASILSSLVNGIIINDTTNSKEIRIRNVSINGVGNGLNGIRVLTGKTFHIENVEIAGLTGNGIDVAITGAAPGNGFHLNVNNVNITRLLGASSIGIKLASANPFLLATFNNVRVLRAPTGMQVGNNSFPVIRNSMFTGGTTGIEMVNAAAGNPRATINNTSLDQNATGLNAGGGTTTRLSQVSITECSTGINNGGGTVQSSGNNPILGNTNNGLTPTIIQPK